ncbi:helix-turn-helix domain-containing protein [Spongiibacter taiwanensis]|uniref:helix-turn-helix domain-containing protein n=1 Tax=Spongiibacter taiwanensis TaxID=1748242 RepID=UPI002035484C|nr:helix-turn-helix transcriptional regulator [Spongiibacter taiwanensis]USA41742.1 helix-turn-helix domain-containing protein [Spongiibacter taiwanensis]
MKITHLTPHATALEEFGQRLARQRKNKGFRQEELAEAAGIGVATLRRMEGGLDAHFSSWIKVLAALGESESLDTLLPTELKSPRLAVQGKAGSAKRRRSGAEVEPGAAEGFRWGDGLVAEPLTDKPADKQP